MKRAKERRAAGKRYCGEYRDAESGEYYLRTRSYNPETGRFTSEDIAKSGTNWYAYCDGDPVGYVDPTGMYGTGADADQSYIDWWNKTYGDGGGTTSTATSGSTDVGDAARENIASGGANLDGTVATPLGNGGTGSENTVESFLNYPLNSANVLPTTEWRISRYGPNDTRYPGHAGFDLYTNTYVRYGEHGFKTPVSSAWSGRVCGTTTGVPDIDGGIGRGNYVIIALDDKYNPQGITQYVILQHLSDVKVEVGQTVSPGTQIGTVGDSGAGGIHLHIELRTGLTNTFDETGMNPNSGDVQDFAFARDRAGNHIFDYTLFPADYPYNPS